MGGGRFLVFMVGVLVFGARFDEWEEKMGFEGNAAGFGCGCEEGGW